MTEPHPEAVKPSVYTLDALSNTTPLPHLNVGDMVSFNNGNVGSLVTLADNLAIDLIRERDKPVIEEVRQQLALQGINFDVLSDEEQDAVLPNNIGYIRRTKTDADTLPRRVMRDFKTGLELLSAELIAKGPIIIATTTPKEFYGWTVRVTPALRLPGMIDTLDATFPFIVAHDGVNLRYGPYDRDTQKIGDVKTPAMLQAIANARGIAGIALSSAGGRKTIHRKGTQSGNGIT